MKTAAQKVLFKTFEASSEKNGIKEFGNKIKQARWSGASYRTTMEAQERRKLAVRFDDDLMKPYQDTYSNQIPAILLAMSDKKALNKVIMKKLKLAENEQRLARYLLEAQNKDKKWLIDKWASFKDDMNEEEVEHYENWLRTFTQQESLFS